MISTIINIWVEGDMMKKIKKILLSSFVTVLLFLAIVTPVVIGADDTVVITFDPTGTVALATKPTSIDFSTVSAGGSEESVGDITLYNNGTVSMTTSIDTNGSVDSGNLTLDEDGTPGEDFFSLQITSSSCSEGNAWFTDTLTTYNDTLGPDSSTTFKITIHLGDISANWGQETTLLNFTGTIDS